MRTVLVIALALSAHAANAQAGSCYIEAGLGPAGEGAGMRIAVGLSGRPVTPVVRTAFSSGQFESAFRPGLHYDQSNVEVGAGLAGTVPVGGPVSLGGGAGLALALAVRGEVDDEPSSFNTPGLEVGLTLPVEATALVRLTERASLALTGSRSVVLGTARSLEPTPEARESANPGVGQWATALGLRFAL